MNAAFDREVASATSRFGQRGMVDICSIITRMIAPTPCSFCLGSDGYVILWRTIYLVGRATIGEIYATDRWCELLRIRCPAWLLRNYIYLTDAECSIAALYNGTWSVFHPEFVPGQTYVLPRDYWWTCGTLITIHTIDYFTLKVVAVLRVADLYAVLTGDGNITEYEYIDEVPDLLLIS